MNTSVHIQISTQSSEKWDLWGLEYTRNDINDKIYVRGPNFRNKIRERLFEYSWRVLKSLMNLIKVCYGRLTTSLTLYFIQRHKIKIHLLILFLDRKQVKPFLEKEAKYVCLLFRVLSSYSDLYWIHWSDVSSQPLLVY